MIYKTNCIWNKEKYSTDNASVASLKPLANFPDLFKYLYLDSRYYIDIVSKYKILYLVSVSTCFFHKVSVSKYFFRKYVKNICIQILFPESILKLSRY